MGSQGEDDFIMNVALMNLPTGRTNLSTVTKSNWEPPVFQVTESYKTIEQTEILHGTTKSID